MHVFQGLLKKTREIRSEIGTYGYYAILRRKTHTLASAPNACGRARAQEGWGPDMHGRFVSVVSRV